MIQSLPLFHRIAGQTVIVLGEGEEEFVRSLERGEAAVLWLLLDDEAAGGGGREHHARESLEARAEAEHFAGAAPSAIEQEEDKATAAELGGAVLLAVGLATRWVSIPLLITMIVAILAVHGEFGWQAIADASAPFANERVMQAVANLDSIRALVREHGDYEALTGSGSIVMLNNGIEFAATYALMLLALMASGGGRYVSLDYFWARWLRK